MSYGMKSYNIVDESEKQPVIYPKRVQMLIDEYKNAGKSVGKNVKMQYQLETVDILEKIFDDRCRLKPESLKVTISAIYRVKNSRSNEEFYYYNAVKSCNNALNEPAEAFSYQGYGFFKKPVVTMKWNEVKGANEPDVTSYKPDYELKWDKDEVKKLLDSSFLPCEYFYVGNVGGNANDPIASPYYQIFNLQDFLEGSFEDLFDMGRLGVSYKEQSSLYMVDAARKKEKENRERALGMRQPQNKHIT
jgi:hypothetical protein